MSPEEIKTEALKVALRCFLSDYPQHLEPEEVLELIDEDDDIIVWQPFEYWEKDDIVNVITSLADDIESTFTQEKN